MPRRRDEEEEESGSEESSDSGSENESDSGSDSGSESGESDSDSGDDSDSDGVDDDEAPCESYVPGPGVISLTFSTSCFRTSVLPNGAYDGRTRPNAERILYAPGPMWAGVS